MKLAHSQWFNADERIYTQQPSERLDLFVHVCILLGFRIDADADAVVDPSFRVYFIAMIFLLSFVENERIVDYFSLYRMKQKIEPKK